MEENKGDDPFEFANGVFEWSHKTKSLYFRSFEPAPLVEDFPQKKYVQKTETSSDKYVIEFKDDIDLIEKFKFNRLYRRKINVNDPKDPRVVILQDIKDLVLFEANPKHLTRDLIMYLHTPQIDNLFRALIIYFQFYFQTWEELKNRREELERKIPQPNVKNTQSEDLATLRAMMSRNLSSIKSERAVFHTSSMNERDKRMCEMLACVAVRVIWHALNKPSLSLIEQECDRLARSDHFNKYEHSRRLAKKSIQTFTESEKRILRGRSDIPDKRLNAKSPTTKELLYGSHDHRFLAVGLVDFPPSDERLRYLEKLYLLPEEEFQENDICIGILGMPRDQFDVTLKPKRKKTHDNESGHVELTFKTKIPPYIYHGEDTVPWRYPTNPPRIKSAVRIPMLMQKMQIWLKRLKAAHKRENFPKDFTTDSCTSSVM